MSTLKNYLIILVTAYACSSCVKCEQCFYIVNINGAESESSLGECCGDEIKALEKKEYTDPAGEARVECR